MLSIRASFEAAASNVIASGWVCANRVADVDRRPNAVDASGAALSGVSVTAAQIAPA